MKKLFVTLVLTCFSMSVGAKVIHLLPRPHQIEINENEPAFSLHRAIRLQDATATPLLRTFLEQRGSIDDEAEAVVEVLLTAELGTFDYAVEGFPNEGYRLSITANRVLIEAATPTGVIRATQTLSQLAEGYEDDSEAQLEALTMTDYPAFKVRGWMQDIGRSYISVEELKREIDLMARFKVNVFHWHLTENQGWRFEVKAYPQLTSAASMTRFAGKYYTQEECTAIEAYAAARGITVIPEIDMPGHSEAFTRAMGFGMQTDAGVAALKVILGEVVEAFPLAPYIHIGGDEVSITYTNFLETLSGVVRAAGKKVVTWNKLVNKIVSADFADMTQMWATSGTKVSGLPNIDCRYNYTNHFDVFADLVGIYKSNIYYEQQGNSDVAGFISAAWNDRNTATEEDIIRQNNVYANVLACAERGWIGGGKQYIEKGGTMLPSAGEEYEEFADWERRFLFHKAHSLSEASIPYVKQTNIHWRITDAFPNGGNAAKQFPPETDGLLDTYEYEGNVYHTGAATGAGIYLRHTWGSTIPTYFSNPQTNTTAYAWTYIYSPEEQTVGANIEFYNYGRSEKDLAPDAGKWDRYGSQIWLNDETIAPPVWENSGVTGITSETLLKNENFTARKPIAVQLQKGWNKVFLKLPFNPDGKQRLQKWMFTFVLTDLEGKDAVEGLIYSPDQFMEEEAQQISSLISEIEAGVSALVGEEVGYYPAESAVALTELIEEVKATLTEELGAEARAEQIDKLQQAYADFQANYASGGIILPQESTAGRHFLYRLHTPLRDDRYLTSQGVGSGLLGQTLSDSQAQLWGFFPRGDGSYDIICEADGSYISPLASNNTQVSTRLVRPTRGWKVLPADVAGYVVLVSGTAQLNQTNSGLGYKIYNWGSGTNISDTGCKYRVSFAEEVPTSISRPETAQTKPRYYLTDGQRIDSPRSGIVIEQRGNTSSKKLYK